MVATDIGSAMLTLTRCGSNTGARSLAALLVRPRHNDYQDFVWRSMEIKNIYRWNGEFEDRLLEAGYRDETRAVDFKTIRVACLLTSTAYLSGGAANYFAFGWSQPFQALLAVRLAAFFSALLCCIISYRSSSRQPVDLLILWYCMFLIFGDSLELYFIPTTSLPEMPTLFLIVLTYYMFFPTRLHLIIAGGLSAGICYCAVAGLVHGPAIPLFSNAIAAFILINAIGVYHVRAMNLAQRMKFMALAGEKEKNARLQEEIAERKRVQQKLFEQATVDELTQIYNRRFFLELAEKELARAKRQQQSLALIMMDLDHFKSINDNHGHHMGDQTLKVVADAVGEDLREGDIIGRFGGEEFALLLPDAGKAEAMNVAERIRRRVENASVTRGELKIRVTASLGVAVMVPDEESQLSQLLKLSDAALYKAKDQGRNRVVMTD